MNDTDPRAHPSLAKFFDHRTTSQQPVLVAKTQLPAYALFVEINSGVSRHRGFDSVEDYVLDTVQWIFMQNAGQANARRLSEVQDGSNASLKFCF